MKKELAYSKILEMLEEDEELKDLLSSDKVVVMHQVWEKSSYEPKGLEIIYSKSKNPKYAVGKKYKFGTGIYHGFLIGALQEGYEVILVNETDGIIDLVMHIQKF